MLKSNYSPNQILQIIGTSLLDKTQLNQLLQKKNNQDVKELSSNQQKNFKFKRATAEMVQKLRCKQIRLNKTQRSISFLKLYTKLLSTIRSAKNTTNRVV